MVAKGYFSVLFDRILVTSFQNELTENKRFFFFCLA